MSARDLGYTALYVCPTCKVKKRGFGKLIPFGWIDDGNNVYCSTECKNGKV